MDETHEIRPPDEPAPHATAPVATVTPPSPPRTGWWRSLDRPSRIALGVAVACLVGAVAVAAFGLSRVSHSSNVSVTAARRGAPGFRFRAGPVAPGGGGLMRGFRTQGVAVAAKTIGISESDLTSQIAAGKSIADVAKAHNVDVQKVIDAIVAAERQQIEDAVKSGNIPQAAATRLEGSLEQVVASRVYAAGGRMRTGSVTGSFSNSS